MIIGVWCSFVLKHYSFEPFKITELANVQLLIKHNGFSDFPAVFVDDVCSIGSYAGLKFKAVILKSLWGTRRNELPTITFLHFLYLSFGCIQSWGEWLYLSQMKQCLLVFHVKLFKDHFFGIVTYY